MGVPTAPKVAGTEFITSVRPATWFASKPRATSRGAAIAAGVPKTFDHELEGPTDDHQLGDGVGADLLEPIAYDSLGARAAHRFREEDRAPDNRNRGQRGEKTVQHGGVGQVRIAAGVNENHQVH
jgi:hypothetical protein